MCHKPFFSQHSFVLFHPLKSRIQSVQRTVVHADPVSVVCYLSYSKQDNTTTIQVLIFHVIIY